ncbi:MAG TPA: MMPL family transporter [Hyalangium sp.]|nr:MMPL family transporter [Hyalangium sp.]
MQSLRQRWFERFIQASLSRPWWVVACFVLLGWGGALLAARLEFRGSFVELLPAGAREVQDLTRVSQKAGGDGYLVLRAQGATPEQLKAYAQELQGRLERLPQIRYVEHHFDVGFFLRNGLMLMPAERLRSLHDDLSARVRYEQRQSNPLYVELVETESPPTFEEIQRKYLPESPVKEDLASADGKEVYLFLKPAGTAADLNFARRFVDEAKAVAAELARDYPGVAVDATGNFQSRIEEDTVMRQDLANAGLLSALLAVGIILLATRRISALAVVGLPVVVGVLLTFAFAQLVIGHLNVVTGFLVAILIGLGIEYGVHLAMRYWEERRHLEVREALSAAVRGSFSGALTSAITNSAAFLVLLVAQFHAFQQFGLLAGMGVMLAVLAAYGLGPSLLAIAERIRSFRPQATPGTQAPAGSAPASGGARWPTPVVTGIALAVVAFAGFSATMAPRLGFETDMRKLKGNSPSSRLDDHITAQLGAPLNPAILLVEDLEQARTVRQIILDVQARHGADSVFLRSASLVDLLPTDVERRQAEIDKLRNQVSQLPASLREDPRVKEFQELLGARPYGLDELPVEARRRFEALDGKGMFLLLFPSVSNYDTRDLHRWAAQLDEVVAGAQAKGIDLSVLDSNRIASRIFALVRGDGPLILGAAAVVVFLAIFASLRSLKRALLVAGPLFLGMVCLAGGMYLFDVQLNFINAVVLPNLLAIAVDNSVHLFHRYEEEGPGSLGHVVRHTGFAAVAATLSNAAGYGALLIASHQGLRSIGQIALLGVVSTFLGTTVFFPALLALLERWKLRHGKGAGEGAVVQSLEIVTADEPAAQSKEQKSA